jgi:hypothetical protein
LGASLAEPPLNAKSVEPTGRLKERILSGGPVWLAVRIALASAGILLAIKYLVFTEGQMLGRPVLDHPVVVAMVLAEIVAWSLPVVLSAVAFRSKVMMLVGAAFLLAVMASALHDAYADNHSTAGIGLFFGLVYLHIAFVLLVFAENVGLWIATNRRRTQNAK